MVEGLRLVISRKYLSTSDELTDDRNANADLGFVVQRKNVTGEMVLCTTLHHTLQLGGGGVLVWICFPQCVVFTRYLEIDVPLVIER